FTTAVATHARIAAADIDAGRQAVDCFFKTERERDLYVGTTLRLRAGLGCCARSAKEFAEHIFEPRSRATCRLSKVEAAEIETTASRSLRRRVTDVIAVRPILVINLALFGIGQDII